ncbi:Potassium voltage-gated channel subfamily H member 6 [Symbiodinium microadriaticum]|uniref:Potassium voltage-gated channel subfamily H member 6 n=2 Tax=Symbiodinium TaxID=2949 RepID=A0A1Q9DGB2_SYMMI|nr:Potassium voltage-gated channel subfamily H member 6 [Symbiodinium microadriaticum]
MGSKSGCGTVPEGMAESSGFSVQIDRLLRALESEILAAHEKEVTAANEEPVQPPPSETATDRVKLPLPPAFAECSETADPSTVHPKPGESESAATSSNHTPIKRYAPNLKLTLSEGSLAEEEIQGFGGSLPRQFHLWSTYTRAHDFAIHMRDDGEEEDMALSAGVDEFARELEQEKKIRSQAKTPRWVLSPNSPKRICWDLLGVIVLLYDLIMIPLYTAFPLQDNIFLSMMTGITLAFWSLDILACFCVGYYAKDGTLVVSLARIAKQYLLSWFPLDVVIVSIDWIIVLALVTEEEGKSAGLMRAGKMLRALRVLRTLRLLRLAKLRQLLNKLQDQVDSEHISVLLDIVKLLILIIFINHFIACAWYLVGCNPPNNESSWLVAEFSVISCDDPVDDLLLYKYTTAMHWSLTQFTPASMGVQPQNTIERSFAIGVLLFALLVFSSFVASLTGATTSLRKMTGRHSSQLWLLRKFLRQRGISLDLQVRINRYINVVLTNTQRYVQYSDVELFGHLSGPLHNELQTELNKPRLLIHPFFVNMLDKFEALMRKVCCSVPVEMALSRGDVLFNGGEEAQHMYFLCSGEGDYWHVESKTFHSLGAEQWFCEAVLWTPWVHQGRVRAKSETELISLSSLKFRDVLSEYPKHMSFMRMYGLVFLSQLQDWYEVSQRLTDLDMDVSVSATTTDFLQLELADVESEAPSLRDDQKSTVSGSSSFWPARSASHQTVVPSPQARYRRAKSKQLLKMSESDILETQSDHGPGFLTV